MSASTNADLFDNFIDPWEKCDRLMFIGCVHAITDEFLWLLKRVADNPPHYLFFGGDVTGSQPFEHLKTLFYECVFNRAHNQLGIGTPNEKPIADEELLNFVGHCPRKPDQTLGAGLLELMGYVYELSGMFPIEAMTKANQTSQREVAGAIRNAAKRDYFGSWHLELPREVRQATAADIEAEAKKLAEALKPIQAAGTKVIMVGGNWDNVENNRQENWGKHIDVFDTVPFYRRQGITFHDKIAITETATALVVSAPYWELACYDHESVERLAEAVKYVGRSNNWNPKTVILLAHGEPNWEVHNLRSPVPSQQARQTVIENLGEIIAVLEPDEVIYPHQHNPLADARGQRLPSRTKYMLLPSAEGNEIKCAIDVVRTKDRHYTSAIMVSYLPFQRLGVLNIPLDVDPRIKPHGQRDPVYVF